MIMQKMKSVEYRRALLMTNVQNCLSIQIRLMREKMRLDREGLSKLSGVPFNVIEQYEDSENEHWDVDVLVKLAHAFDVALEVKFKPFSEVFVGRDLTPKALTPQKFTEETAQPHSWVLDCMYCKRQAPSLVKLGGVSVCPECLPNKKVQSHGND